ncbi:MAG: PKD domain-containing protein [Candidatus Portnoybacteria bacterium]|nr:PKD domain-containing protein [Candidatus Portnoybacteria bacterium]
MKKKIFLVSALTILLAISAFPQKGTEKPRGPKKLRVLDYGESWVQMKFLDTARNESGFQVEHKTSPSGPWSLYQNLPANPGTGTVFFRVDGLMPGKMHHFQVRAYNEYYSCYSNEVHVKTNSQCYNNPPIAKCSAEPNKGQIPLAVFFSAEGSYDPDGDEITFKWDFNDGFQSHQKSFYRTFESPGIYSATLTVKDSRSKKDTCYVEVEAKENPPVPSCDVEIEYLSAEIELFEENGKEKPRVMITFGIKDPKPAGHFMIFYDRQKPWDVFEDRDVNFYSEVGNVKEVQFLKEYRPFGNKLNFIAVIEDACWNEEVVILLRWICNNPCIQEDYGTDFSPVKIKIPSKNKFLKEK